jgi:DNA-binding response OmpR family regulator
VTIQKQGKEEKPLKVLIVEDSEEDTILLLRELRKEGYTPLYKRVDTAVEMSDALDAESWDIIISDHLMPTFSSLDALRLLHTKGLDLPFIIVSGQIGEETAVGAMKAGANDYVMKGNLNRLVPAIEREIIDAQVRRERLQSKAELTAQEEELLRMHARHLAILNRISQSLSEAKDFDSLLKKALDGIVKAMRFSSGVLFLQDETTREFKPAANNGVNLELINTLNQILVRATTDSAAKNSQRPGFLKHFLDHTLVIDSSKLELPSTNNYSMISVPLKSAGKLVAMVILVSSGKTILSKEEKQLLNTLGSQAGVAIENNQGTMYKEVAQCFPSQFGG